MRSHPLIPAKAGTQVVERLISQTGRKVASQKTPSLVIWAPAFAGVSGVR